LSFQTSVITTEEYNVRVNSEEFIGTTEYLTLLSRYAKARGRAVQGVGLRPLACLGYGFEFHRGHGWSGRGLCVELITRL